MRRHFSRLFALLIPQRPGRAIGWELVASSATLVLAACSTGQEPVAVAAQAVVVATAVAVATPPQKPIAVGALTPGLAAQGEVEAALVAGQAQTHRRVTGTRSRDLKLLPFASEVIAPDYFHFRLAETEFVMVEQLFYVPVGEQWVPAPEWRIRGLQQITDELLLVPQILHAQILGPMELDGVATQVYEYVARPTTDESERLQQVKLWVRLADNLPIKAELHYEEDGVQVFEVQLIDYTPRAVSAALQEFIGRPIAEGRLAGPWQEFTSAPGQFLLLLPGTPQEQVQTLQTANGPVDFHLFTVDLSNISYTAAYGDYPPDSLAAGGQIELLIEAQAEAIANVHGTLLAEETYTVAGYPGSAARIVAQDGQWLIRLRMVLVGNRLYQLMAAGAPDLISHSTTDQFLDSFQILSP